MRLQAIKLAGFKSFVDPTTVPFPSNLCAVVGPNGCGKSNIIDAVRWVMGESSAKTLRGESMADVIFNGSTSRKPVGQASIELLFDNTEGRLNGEYAAYSELSIKRQVSRDGQSNYYLNSQKCRRKDITDIFLGTGLGPRSYSIIEQGMISQLIEAKPEDLRVYIEEAAGISKYKERRRETERRIKHTRDNLDRLSDLREELGRQLHHLERQAKAAERYTGHKKEERRVKAQLQGLKWQAITREAVSKEENISRLQIEQEARIADQRHVDAEIEAERDKLVQFSDELNNVQKQFYDFGTEIARIEDGIQFQNERNRELNTDLEQVSENWQKVRADLEDDERLCGDIRNEIAEIAPQQKEMEEHEEVSGTKLLEAEGAMQDWQREWDSFNHTAAESRQEGEVGQSRISHLEESIERLDNRLLILRNDLQRLQDQSVEEEIEPLESMLQVQEQQLARIGQEIAELSAQIETGREQNSKFDSDLDIGRSELQAIKGRFASLEALQQTALGQQDDAEMGWLEKHGLSNKDRLAEKIRVEPSWELAIETVLGDYLQSVFVEDLEALPTLLADFDKGALNFIADTTAGSSISEFETLASKVTGDISIESFLGNVLVATDLDAAMTMRSTLVPGQSIVTPDGVWIGSNWLRISKDHDATAGVIKRQAEMETMALRIEQQEQEVASLTQALESGNAGLAQVEADRDKQQARLAEQQRTFGETRAQLVAKKLQAEQLKTDLARANSEIESSTSHLQEDHDNLGIARNKLQVAMDRMEEDTKLRQRLISQRDQVQQRLDEVRSKAKTDRDAVHQLALRVQSLNSRMSSTELARSRLQDQERILGDRKASLEKDIRESEEPQGQLKTELAEQLEKRLEVENELTRVRQKSEATEHKIRQLEQDRAGFEEQVELVRTSLEQVRIDFQGLEVRRDTIREQMAEENQDLDEVLRLLPEEANEEEWEDLMRRVNNRILRLGAINLAAIDEFKVQSERKQYLDAQNEDLERALQTLENAIRKIDVETRTRFKETFDKVNVKLQQIFPKLFAGGHAYLEMTGEDLLDTGIGLMARPPGKRNSSIHLLSGGEKALTAIALVFSIFSLNPAPFCLLDEVDAPLDDTNVQRYSDLVKEMSRTVQFIYITHNKIAMEMGEQLMGVTMHEPGVSRLVSVDVDEAVAMAAV
ncbi:MAG: chromosome segregation protein SMC [Gammaproteobacteria bacterium]|jgi:chromosome segregation protein|nr:chromosome segregation protein SMC [Gammaproteobacteria bacterium]|tara:strand:+ start:1761 stop:5264 length:3504 start_codon:yes stop_codon:yes gene_type:complete